MLIPDQVPSNRLDLGLPYAKLARHITAMHEIVRLAPTNDPSAPGNPSAGLSPQDRSEITKHLRECLDMIGTLEKWMLNPVVVVGSARSIGLPSDPPPPETPATAYDHDAELVEWINRHGRYPSEHELSMIAGYRPRPPYWWEKLRFLRDRVRSESGDDADESRLTGR